MFTLSLLAAWACLLHLASGASVIAHFMVQNTYAYDINQWKTDMVSAQEIGIDGFALNWIPPNCQDGLDWTVDRIDDAYAAAEQLNFKLVHSFDMSYSVCNVFWNQTFMQDMISTHADSPAAYRWNGNLLVTTYGGDQVSQYGNQFFQNLKNTMASSNNPIVLAPALTKYSMGAQANPEGQSEQLMSDYPSIDGYLNWQAWPLNKKQNITCTPDQAFNYALKSAGRKGPYIMAISPWQYKDLNNGVALDSWVAYSDTLFPDRFSSLAGGSNGINPDIIEILTWNDFAESHYLRDLPPQYNENAKDFVELGDMGNYVWGQNHAAWRIIAKYYLTLWKTGAPPAITTDQVVFWYRIHPKDAVCSGGSSTGVRNHLFPDDAVFAWALVKSPATISMSVGSNKYQTFQADSSGPVVGKVNFPSDLSATGVKPEVAIMRNNKLVRWAQGSKAISTNCAWQNFNPVVNLCGAWS